MSAKPETEQPLTDVPPDTGLNAAQQQFDILCKQYYQSWFRYHPEQSVVAGYYEHADKLRAFEHDDIGALIALNQKMLSALVELNAGELDRDRAIDYRILSGAIAIELHDLEENDWRYRNPIDYLPVNAIYQLLAHPAGDFHRVFEARLCRVESHLRGARMMLASYPERVVPEWTQTAIDMAAAGAKFISELGRHPSIVARYANPVRLQSLLDEAAHAINDFGHFLKSDVLPAARGKYAAGHYRFNRLLAKQHFFGYDESAILEFGIRLVAASEAALLDCCEKLCGKPDVQQAMQKMQSEHALTGNLLDAYRAKINRAHDWLMHNNIVTMPETQAFKVIETPSCLADPTGFTRYQPPACDDELQAGLFYVAAAGQQRETPDEASLDVTSVHEAFPGHHLQFVLANQHNRHNPVRLLNGSATLYDGWAHYCEQLMYEQGYYHDDSHRFAMLRNRLWRALQVVIDVKIHTGQMTFDQAAELLTEKLGFDDARAHAEIAWYSNAATVPLSYALGCEIIQQLREMLLQNDDGSFDDDALKQFHDALLSQGSIALPLVIQRVFDDTTWNKLEQSLMH